jgi:hypothetical protein
VDPDSMNSDPDTDPDQAFQVNPDSDTDPIRIQGFDDQKLKKKKYSRIFYISFLIKNCNFLISKLQEKPSALKQKRTPSKK